MYTETLTSAAKEILPLHLHQWFDRYIDSFDIVDTDTEQHFGLKINHSLRVCNEMTDLCIALDVPGSLCTTAVSAALLHDIGRFSQYFRFHTFLDRDSVDHAALGVEELQRTGALESLPPLQQEQICSAIGLHNKAAIPVQVQADDLLLARMLRDADKIDIWKVVTDYYLGKEGLGEAVVFSLPDTPLISPKVVKAILDNKLACLGDICTVADIKVLQMGWVFDLNFVYSAQLVRKRAYLDIIADSLPKTAAAARCKVAVMTYLDNFCAQSVSA